MQALLLIGAAVWRIQASHLLVFVLAPAAAAAVRLALGVVLLPFLLVGLGHKATAIPPEADHLRSPGCWVALAPCALAERTLWAFAGSAPADPGESLYAVKPEPFLPVPTDLTVRHAWFLVWLGWFVAFLVRRSRKRRRSA